MPREKEVYVECSVCGKVMEASSWVGENKEMRLPIPHMGNELGKMCEGGKKTVPVVKGKWTIERKTEANTVTPKEKIEEIYNAILRYKEENNGNSPSMRWLQNECSMASLSTLFKVLLYLEENGYIKMKDEKYRSRSISVIGSEWAAPEKEYRYSAEEDMESDDDW